VKRLRERLDMICEGNGVPEDLKRIERMARSIKESALCGLGKTAPNPVLSTLTYFKDEYLEHILQKRCPAGVCKSLSHYSIDKHACIGCGACAKACPADAITGQKKKVRKINTRKCIACGACREACPADAVIT
ncbi:NADH-ubiquinone oxidoreductase-F iron-sulfur binding region domain-containing protein, partial [Thermodesulfobacteriota bacterium]